MRSFVHEKSSPASLPIAAPCAKISRNGQHLSDSSPEIVLFRMPKSLPLFPVGCSTRYLKSRLSKSSATSFQSFPFHNDWFRHPILTEIQIVTACSIRGDLLRESNRVDGPQLYISGCPFGAQFEKNVGTWIETVWWRINLWIFPESCVQIWQEQNLI